METNKTALREKILDILIDGDENIEQIERHFQIFKIAYDRELLKNTLIELLTSSFIEIAYPSGKKVIDFQNSDDAASKEFWFHITDKGRKEWEKIDWEKKSIND